MVNTIQNIPIVFEISKHAPVGPIKRNKIGEGVVSPLYSVFRFNDENLEYFEYYFSTNGWHQ